LLKVEWMKELIFLFTLIEGVSESLPIVILVFIVSNNTQSQCISHPFVISPENNKNPI
jgi:hypothetical protein